MPYVRRTWQNAPSSATPLNAAALNNIEDGVEEAVEAVTGRLSEAALETTIDAGVVATGTPIFAPVATARPGNRVVYLGDSLTQWQDNFATGNHAQRTSLANFMSILSKQRAQYVRNAGVGGDTTTQMLARFDTDVTPHAPNCVHLLGGTNDIALTVPQTLANLSALIAKIRAIGAAPIIGTPPPKEAASTGERTRIAALAAGIRRLAASQGIALADYYAALIDPTDGGIATAWFRSGDNVHPSDAGFAEMARVGAAASALVLPPWSPPLAQENADPNNLIANGLGLNKTGGDYPSSFSGGSAMTGLTRSFVTADPEIKGDWYKTQFDGTTASTYQLFQNIATAPVPGHRYLFAGRIKTNWVSGANAFTIRNRITATATLDVAPLLNVSATLSDGTFYTEYVCPTGATSQQLSVIVPAGVNGFIQWAQLTLYDLTAMGLA